MSTPDLRLPAAAVPFAPLETLEQRQLLSVSIGVDTSQVIRNNFGGLGYNIQNDQAYYSQQDWESVIAKRLTETNTDGFARISLNPTAYQPTEGNYTWASSDFTEFVQTAQFLEDIGTTILIDGRFKNLPAWLGGGDPTVMTETMKVKYADAIVDGLIVTEGLSNIGYWAAANELDSQVSDYFRNNLGVYTDLHVRVQNELASRGLSGQVKMLLTESIEQARISIQETINLHNGAAVTDAFGHHFYKPGVSDFNDPTLGWMRLESPTDANWTDPLFSYNAGKIFTQTESWLPAGSDYVIGEFGPYRTYTSGPNTGFVGLNQPMTGIQLTDTIISAINAGVSHMARWELYDHPRETGHYYNRLHGVMQDWNNNWTPHAEYYSYALFTRYFRGGSSTFNSTITGGPTLSYAPLPPSFNPGKTFSSNETIPLIRVAAARHNAQGDYAVVVTNRATTDQDLNITLQNSAFTGKMRYWVYDGDGPAPTTVNGDLPTHTGEVNVTNGVVPQITLSGNAMLLLTSDFDEVAPGAVIGLAVTPQGTDANALQWIASSVSDLAYYRIFRNTADNASTATQIASTIATSFTDSGLTKPTARAASGFSVVLSSWNGGRGFELGIDATGKLVANLREIGLVTSDLTVPLNQWSYVAVSYDFAGTSVGFHVGDGTTRQSETRTIAANTKVDWDNITRFIIGATGRTGTGLDFAGEVDAVSLYGSKDAGGSGVLSDESIQWLMRHPLV